MGAWSIESFGCDEACDWAGRLKNSTDLAPIDAALDAIVSAGDIEYLDAKVAIEGICAAEAVARMRGHFGRRDAYSADVDDWVARIGLPPSPALVDKASRALERVLTEPSELMDLWSDEVDGGAAWRAGVLALKERVGH